MSQVCGKIPSKDDVDAIRKSIEEYFKQHASNAQSHGSRGSGQTIVSEDGTVHIISPYNQGEVIQSEVLNPDGSIHYTTINTETGVRHSYDVDQDGNITHEHTTDQNVPKHHRDRHK